MSRENIYGKGIESYLAGVKAGQILAGGSIIVSNSSGNVLGVYEIKENGNLAGMNGSVSVTTAMISSDKWKYVPPVEKKYGKREQ